jgi:hypothetical protein
VGADFVWRMEDVLDLYAEPYDPRRPWVCFDEKPYQLLSDVRPPQPAAPGRAARVDYEYKREGTCNLFLLLDPHRAWRRVTVTAQRAAADFAHQMKWLVDEGHPEAAVIRVVLDNLSTHTAAALYQTFPPAEARRIARRLEFHYTPKHASWLNMAEIEFSVLERQCLDRRLATQQDVERETSTWTAARNAAQATIHWHFTTAHARTKLHRLYPSHSL